MSGALSHLCSADRTLFYQYGFGSRRSVEIPVIHHAFEKHAQLQPEAIAVEHSVAYETITYGHLESRANQLAHLLRARGIVPGKRVCILARRSIWFIVAILAVLKSGGQYVPLDGPTITDETLQFVLSDADPSIVLVMQDFHSRVPAGLPTLGLSSPSDGAYCIYTSGTTGRPKGVDVRHRGVTNVISGSPGNVGMRPGMRVAQLLNIAFDMGAWEVLGAMYNGCTLCLRVEVVIATPSMLARHEPEDYPTIKHVIVGGEPCSQALADKWARYTNFNNCCGPTEISICNTVQPHTSGYPLSIGRPIPNTNVYILSRDPFSTEVVAIGEVGCMWVGGIGVSNGYLNLPEKNAERWKKDPFVENGMMFNTGDLGRWRKDGQLDHMGRVDDQVKVKGFRVELDGVSAAMRTYEPVRGAVALLIGSELWGFVTPLDVDLTLLRNAVAKVQPYYAVPTQFRALDEFPVTSNGKVDKRALRRLAEGDREVMKFRNGDDALADTAAAVNEGRQENGHRLTLLMPSVSGMQTNESLMLETGRVENALKLVQVNVV
ncbi:hypothetical protein BDQ17DRAFT_1396862 [Cyathus striatus]|nr:hypothetical protein BDQ17DRAFT_1396862 [Cyathus striatus]